MIRNHHPLPRFRPLLAAALLLAGTAVFGASPPSPATTPTPLHKVRVLADPAAPKPESTSLATQVSMLLAMGIAVIFVWRVSGSKGKRRRRPGRIARRSRVDLQTDDKLNPFDKDH